MKTKIIFQTIFLQVLLITSCKTLKFKLNHPPFEKETITIKLVDQKNYKYLYYNLSDTGLSIKYNIGEYYKSGKYYNLKPDSVRNDEFIVRYQQRRIDTLGNNFKIEIKTDISDDHLNQNKIILFNKTDSLYLKGIKIDTVLKNFKFKDFRIKIFLADKYLKGKPAPSFTFIITKKIFLNPTSNMIDIEIPAEWMTFYYKYEKSIQLIDTNKYWNYNNKNILKDNTLLK